EDTDGFNMDDIGSMETPAGESDFSGIEFPDIDLSQSVDMGGETPSPEAGGSDGIEFPDIDLSQAVDMGGETASPQISMEDDSGAFSAGEDISGDEDYSFDLDQGEAGSFGETLPETGDFSMDMPDGDDFNAGDFVSDDSAAGDFDTGDIGFDAGSGSFDAGQTDDFDFNDTAGDFSTEESLDIGSEDLGSGFDTEFGESDQDITLDTEDIGNFDDIPASAETGDESIDPFESFASGDTTLDTPDFNETPADEFGDFSLSGFDDVGESGKPAKAAAFGTTQGSPDEVEEIQLNEDDYQQLQDTLSAYPLNLRIACEELIAEQAVAPDKMSALVNLLVRGAPAKETAGLAGKILGKTITIPKGYSKKTGAELEAEQASFGYIFTHRFLPVLKIAGAIVLVTASLGYLIWRFAVIPLQAERRYKEGYALIQSGEYVQANERFRQAFEIHRVKNWFYRYAEAFRDERQYIYAERKYDELLRVYPQDKKGALDYAAMETYYIRNYEKADRIIRVNILDYAVNDKEGLLALAENSLAWGETDYSRYDEAREAYARLMEKYGKQDPYLEGMLKYFIRTDNLKEVLPLQAHFMSNPKKRKISVPTLAELGGYLLDKRFEDTGGVPEEFADQIEGIRDVLIRAINADRSYPESYYHLARYYSRYGNINEERQSLRDAIRAFSSAPEESPRRVGYHIDTQRLYAEILINSKEFFPAEEELIRGVRLYEDARARGIIKNPRPEFGRLYADLGDLEFYVKSGDMDAALRFYQEAERNDWSPPEMQYRMGVAYYQNEQWEEALMRFFTLTSVMPNNRRLLYALGNTAYLRGNYFAAQGYYNRLMDLLDAEKVRFPSIFPGGRPEEQDLAERIMVADNNLGVTLETLTRISGDTSYRSRALALFSESIRAWDVLTRDPESMARMQPIRDLYSPGINLAYLNTQNILRPSPNYEQQIFMRIDRDSQEPSDWEILVPRNYRLSDQLQPMTID
ncbi:MAG: tetratricopeptide repeat protein, partial [Treponema sp.]|nr:tetratricopeptide repeat protein [Treponema sp.]